jgi:hypothetical protein
MLWHRLHFQLLTAVISYAHVYIKNDLLAPRNRPAMPSGMMPTDRRVSMPTRFCRPAWWQPILTMK